jgi:hypothetical protein
LLPTLKHEPVPFHAETPDFQPIAGWHRISDPRAGTFSKKVCRESRNLKTPPRWGEKRKNSGKVPPKKRGFFIRAF